MTINAVAIAEAWNAPVHDLDSTPLSKEERVYAEGRSYSLKVTLKDGRKKDIRLIADRRVDALIEMVTTAEDELWDEQIAHVEIEDVTEKFE